jgi:hypothetical protein
VAVDVAGDGDGGVAEDLRDHLELDAVAEHGAGCGVSKGVESGAGQAGSRGRGLEGAQGVARVARLAELGGEHTAGDRVSK